MKKNKVIGLLICSILCTFIFVDSINVQAKSKEELQEEINSNNNKINKLEDEKEKVESDKQQEKSKIQEIQSKIQENSVIVKQSITKVNEHQNKIDALQYKIDETNNLINEVQTDIKKTEKNIEVKNKEKADKEEMLGKRIRNVYKTNYNDQIIYMMLSSADLGDLISKITNIGTIVKKDNELIDQIKNIQKELQVGKEQLKQKKQDLDLKQKEIVDKRNEVKESQKEFLDVKNKYETEVAQLQALEDSKNEVIKSMNDKEKELQNQIVQFEEDNADLSHYFDNIGKGDGGGNSGQVSPGGFMRPTGGSITSPFGMRYHPTKHVYKLHTGTDFGVGSGTPIKASKDGIVSTATYDGSYGNMVIINHGGGYSTLYAHQTNYIVRPGQQIKQGQVIGYVGSTGASTGPHLHFEVRINGEPKNPMDYL